MRQQGVQLTNMTSGSDRDMGTGSVWGEAHMSESQEELAKPGRIAVKSTVRVISSEVGKAV
jgi:hypothetical protein